MLERFAPSVREWFATSFDAPTPPQRDGWPAIADGRHVLICAPTGSGKTLTAFLWCIDRLVSTEPPDAPARTRVLYVSPLRALAFDVEKNLRAPIVGIRHAAERLGEPFREPTVGLRTGDTSAAERRRLRREPPDVLITTPESLFLMLTSEARATLRDVETVIIDEIHSLAPTKRGAHLMLSLERLEALAARPPQRIGLSATQRPLEEVAAFLGGARDGRPRDVHIVDAGSRKALDLEVVVAVEDMSDLGAARTELRSGPASAALAERRTSIWPSIYPRILDLVLEHRSTIVFCNARRQAERLASQLNDLAAERGIEGELVRAHHGSLAREQRIQIEDQLKEGRLRGIVATSSLELGIDMGAVDLVVQVESPGAVSRGMQRVGRAGHQVGAPSVGRIFPKHRHDLLESAVVVRAMHDAEIETTRYLRTPLDVLAQQIVAHVAMHPDLAVTDLAAMVRRAAPFAETTDGVLHGVLDLLAGRYPSEEFRELRPRIVWDRVRDTLRAREGAQRLAVTNAGTIPDRGLFGVFMPDGTRVGELDEEMVYETRPGETFLLGASTWRIEDITHDRVVVTPAPGQPGKMPFWHGDRLGRPVELGRAVGAFVREVRGLGADRARERLRTAHGLDELAAGNLLAYLAEQEESTGTVPDDRTILVERFRDDIGDWRVCIHTPFGTPVHAPWAMAIERRLGERWGVPVDTMYGDDGIVLRLPEAIAEVPMDELFPAPEVVHDEVVAALPETSLFAARFRECAARALLLPRRRPGERTPLWQQRQRAADLLAVAARHPTFPILLETSRECLQDVFDVPALRDVLSRVRSRAIRVVSVDTPKASPFAQGLLFNWIAAYMYEGDAPLAERRAAALALDRDLLNELLGAEELRELLDPRALADLEASLQHLAGDAGAGRGARSADELHDVLRRVGDLAEAELAPRVADGADAAAMAAALVAERRAVWLPVAGERRLVAAEDASRYRDALGCALPPGLPGAFTDPVATPLADLVARYARSHGPFLARDVAGRLGVADQRVLDVLAGLERDHRVVRGEFRPGGTQREWCDVEVLRQLRRRSLAALRREIEPVEQRAYVRFLAGWHGIPGSERGAEHLHDVVHALQGASIVASTLLSDVLPSRVRAFHPGDLDAMCTGGELVWVGAGAVGGHDGRVRLLFADQAALLLPAFEPPERPEGPLHDTIRAVLAERGACFWPQIRAATSGVAELDVVAALWDLVWAGEVTNDSIAPLRAMLERRPSGRAMPSRPGRARLVRPRVARTAAAGPPTVAGRWGLVRTVVEAGAAPTSTQVAHAVALQLLERHGVLTREAVLAESVRGGFAGVYGVLKVLEERGTVRRGYFIDGLGAAQFAVPGAVDRLRAAEPLPEPIVLAATDPAQPFGATLDWPETPGRPARTTGAVVVVDDGEALAWIDLRGHHLVTFPASLERTAWVDALVGLVKDGRTRSIDVRKIDGMAHDADDPRVRAIREALCARGFIAGYRGLGLRDLTRPGR